MRNKKMLKKKEGFIDYFCSHFYVILPDRNIVLWYRDGFIYSQCHKLEEFDSHKGVLVCLSKAAGVSYTDIKEKLKKRGCEDSDSAELFYLYDLAKEKFFLTEKDIDMIVNNVQKLDIASYK
jgi:hypothetical protein